MWLAAFLRKLRYSSGLTGRPIDWAQWPHAPHTRHGSVERCRHRLAAQYLVDDIDRRLVALLARDSRKSIRDLARELGLAPSTVHARLRRLVAEGVIKRFTILPDYEMLGYGVTALILLQVEGGKIVDVGEYISRDPHVIMVYDITGDYDLAVIAKFRNVSDLDQFLKNINRLPYVKRSVTSMSLRVLKEDFVSPLVHIEARA